MRQKARVKFFKQDLGWGFLVPDNGGPDVYVHHSQVDAGGRQLVTNDVVTFETRPGKNDKPAAFDVQLVDEVPSYGR
jgi:CspA family cold shock protein